MKFHWLTLLLICLSSSLIAQQSTILYFTAEGVYAGPPNKSHQDFIPLPDYSKNGIVTSWDDMVKSLKAGLKEKSIVLKEKAVMAVVSTTFSKETHQQLCNLFLGEMGATYYTVTFDAVCALRATNKESGTAIMMNTGSTQVIPILNNRPVFKAIGHQQEATPAAIAETVYKSLSSLNEKDLELVASAAVVEGVAVKNGMPLQINQALEAKSENSILLNFFSALPMKRLPENPTVYAIFKGATSMNALYTFEEMWISKEVFDGKGSDAIKRFLQ